MPRIGFPRPNGARRRIGSVFFRRAARAPQVGCRVVPEHKRDGRQVVASDTPRCRSETARASRATPEKSDPIRAPTASWDPAAATGKILKHKLIDHFAAQVAAWDKEHQG